MRVLVAGLFHETHTFLAGSTGLADFEVRVGAQMLECAGDASPLGGALAAAKEFGWTVLPTADFRASPSATVTDEVVESFWREFHQRAEPELARGVDGIFLVLHGAMVSESLPDVEGELLARLRALVAGRGGRVARAAAGVAGSRARPRLRRLRPARELLPGNGAAHQLPRRLPREPAHRRA